MKKMVVYLMVILFAIGIGPMTSQADSIGETIRIEGIDTDVNLKDNPNVHLDHLDELSSRLYTIVDNEKNYYFCLDESLYYPDGDFSYELDDDYQYTGNIVWLLNNFYSHLENSDSQLPAFKNENFETQYAATQIAIWFYTNPENFTGSGEKVITGNEIVQSLIQEADRHKGEKNPLYKDLLEELEQSTITISDIVPTGEDGDYYVFESKIEDNLTTNFFVTNEDIQLDISLSKVGTVINISDQTKISLDKANRSIELKVPKTIVNENKEDGTLILTAKASIESKNKYYLRYAPIGTSIVQPIATRNTLKKNVRDVGAINMEDVTNFSVVKEWDDQHNQDGLRPTEISVQLYANGQEYGEPQLLTKDNDWFFIWNNLPKTDEQGNTIEYTVKEIATIPGYTDDVVVVSKNLHKLVNRHLPETVSIKGVKTWNDGENQDGLRPEAIYVQLFANGELLTTRKVTEEDNWSYLFADLPKYSNGEVIHYEIKEEIVPGYNQEIVGYDLTNSHTPAKTSVKVTKEWDDQHNQDGLRPANIQVQLYGNNKKIGEEVTLSEENKWTYKWDDLAVKENGQTITYTVKEVTNYNGYGVSINNKDPENIVITNTHVPELTEIRGTKTWHDHNDQDGIRPESITVNLLADGVKIAEQKVTEKDKWSYQFTELPKYNNGQEIVYTVTENHIPEYSTKIDGVAITNKYTPGKTSVTVTKAWHDQENQDGLRPESIQVQLYGNGEKVGEEMTLSADNKWTHTWQDLAEKAGGQRIEYTVKETTQLPGYEIVVNNENSGNILITNTHVPELTEISGNKTWEDQDNQAGLRPASITVNLLADGTKVAEQNVTEKDNWTYRFAELPKYNGGKEIVYTVTENAVPAYSTEINGTTIINNYTPEKTSVTVTKAWNDQNNQAGLRPKTINVQLYADGKKTGEEVTLEEKNNWTHTWQDLAEKADDKVIVYTVQEVTKVSGYEATSNNENHGNIILTNTHQPDQPTKPTKPSNGRIPKFGETQKGSLIVIGLLLCGAGGWIVSQRKRN